MPNFAGLTSKQKGDFQLLADAALKQVRQASPKFAEPFAKRVGELRTQYFAFVEKLEAIRTSGRFTAGGERAELRLAARTLRDKLATLRTEWVEKLNSQLAEQRAAALKPKITTQTDPALALVTELRMRELRDELRKLDSTALAARVKQAADDGAGTDLLNALEGAPVGFPIVPSKLLQEVREQIALQSHPELGELAQLRDAYAQLLNITDNQVVSASGLSPLELGVEAATA